MKLKNFRIRNYKSILDSGVCELASDITILVGKNESGKSAVLEALRDFDREVYEVPDSAVPLDGSDSAPRIELNFQPDQTDIAAIQAACGNTLDPQLTAHFLAHGLRVAKDAEGHYYLNDELLSRYFEESGSQQKAGQKEQIQSAKERLNSLLEGRFLPDLNLNSSVEEIQRKSRELTSLVKAFLPSMGDQEKAEQVVESLRQIIRETKGLTDQETSLKEIFLRAVIGLLPRFVYFSELIVDFPFSIPIDKIKETEPMIDFARICGLDLDRIINASDIQKRINILNRYSAMVNGEFGDFWKQDHIELVLKPEGNSILFGIKERNRTDIFKVEQRSKGFQWFLSFYLRLSAHRSKDNVILIDEPGTNLHAKAQKEILQILQKIALETPVLISTHSPYFVDPLRLDRIRLVQKNAERGSVVSNHIEKEADSDTLMPINTALKMNMAGGFPLSGKRNVIVQELADYYFLDGMKRYARPTEPIEYEFLPCSGDSGSLEQLISLLKGFGFDFRVVPTRGASGQATADELQKTFGLKAEYIANLSPDPALSVEDLFETTDFYSSVAGGEIPENRSLPNSQYYELHNLDRLLVARNFHEQAKAGTMNFSEHTLTAFQKVFDRILEKTIPAPISIKLPAPANRIEPEIRIEPEQAGDAPPVDSGWEVKEAPKEEVRQEPAVEPGPVAAQPEPAPVQEESATEVKAEEPEPEATPETIQRRVVASGIIKTPATPKRPFRWFS